jgi:hypothetical protein
VRACGPTTWALGGSLDPEPDSDSPFFDPDEQSSTQQQHFIGIESCSRSLALVKPELLQIAERLAQAAPDLDIRSDQCDLIRIYFHGRSTVVTVAAINGGYEGRALLITPDILEANRPVAYLKFDGLAGVSQLAQWVRSIRSTCD